MMGELLKRQNEEIQRKENKRQPTQQRVLYKEFSRPVRAANHLENRLMLERIAKAARLSKKNQFKYDREVDDIHQLEKTLTVKSIDFDGEEFHKIHEKQCRVPNIRVPTVNDILNRVPSNCVLEFGPGNQIIEKTPKNKRQMYHQKVASNDRFSSGFDKSQVHSKYAKYFRSKSASPSSTRERMNCQRRPMTSRGHIREPEMVDELPPRSQSVMRFTTQLTTPNRPISKGVQNRQNDFTEQQSAPQETEDSENEDEHKSKSYRTLKEMFTYKEEDETPVPDKKVESLKRLKTKERITFENLDNRVKAFTKKLCKTKY